MINPINHYAITSGQPGVINEEAYTVLQLVGQIGAKTNECVEQVNENTQATGEFDDRITTAQETADGAQEAADAAQRTANGASANASRAVNAIDDMTMYLGIPWYGDSPEDGGELTNGFIQHLFSVVAQILNNNGKYYDLTSDGPGNRCNVLKINGYCPTQQIDNGENCIGIVSIELDLLKPVSGLSRATILVHYTQQIASDTSAYGQGTAFDLETAISLPAAAYSATNPYDDSEFFSNRICTCNVYQFQM
jgi:hypothetical protein